MNDLNGAGKGAEGREGLSGPRKAVQPEPTRSRLPKMMKRVLIGIGGGTVLLIGIAMIVLPGPAVLVIPAGLAILAIEFAWAGRWLKAGREAVPRWFKDGVVSVRGGASALLRRMGRSVLPDRS